MTRTDFDDYCGSPGYHNNLLTGLFPSTKTTTDIQCEITKITPSRFCCGVKRDKSHHMELKDDKYFISWNHNL
jgi:hypothetical protein